jgi:hypothetical protein
LVGRGRERSNSTTANHVRWKLLRLGWIESADVDTRSEMGRRIAATEIGIISHVSAIATVTYNRIGRD